MVVYNTVMVTENYRQLAIKQVAAMLKMKEDMGSVESIARRLGVTRSRLYQLAWAYNEKGGTAETVTAPEQPNDLTAERNLKDTSVGQETEQL